MSNACTCSQAPRLIFACSGASDVGAISDQAARKMTREGNGRMYCLAGIGGRIEGITATTKGAAKILAIDGCAHQCAKATLEQAGFTDVQHLQLGELGLTKGQSPMSDATLQRVADKGAELLA